MTEWNRRALLDLVDEAETCLGAPQCSAAQRRALQALLDQYINKAKSINASDGDVVLMRNQLAQILDSNRDHS